MIFNLTQHAPTAEQLEAGVTPASKDVSALLTFVGLPTKVDIEERAQALATLAEASGFTATMVGGAPYLMAPLCNALEQRGITPLFSFTERQSVETVQADGSVVKTAVFRHVGFVQG